MTTLELLKTRFAQINEELDQLEPGSKEHSELMKAWKEVHECIMAEDKAQTDLEFKNMELMKPWYKKIDINTVLSIGATIGTTLLVLDFEKLGNITSKAFGWIPKQRIK